MAKLKLSGLITYIRGSIGGTTFQNTSSGLIMRNKPIRTPESNIYAHNLKLIIAKLGYNWQLLTDQERNIWNNWAKFVKQTIKNSNYKLMNGRQCFIRTNMYLTLYNQTTISNPPFIRSAFTEFDIVLNSSGTGMYLFANRTLVPAEEFVILYLTRAIKNSITKPGSRLRLIIFESGTGYNINITTGYTNPLGTVAQPTQYVFAKFSIFSLIGYTFSPWTVKKVYVDYYS